MHHVTTALRLLAVWPSAPRCWVSFVLVILLMQPLAAQVVSVGSGSYTQTFPGTDAAGRNGFPAGTPLTTGSAAGRPVPTNDWWSHKVKNNHSSNLFSYPFTLKTVNAGLVTTYIPWGVIDNIEPVIVGVEGLSASAAKVSDFSDWTVTMDWQSGTHHFQATAGLGMPFLYFTKAATDVAQITVNNGTVQVSNEKLIINDLRNGADFVVYAPMGSTWTQAGNVYRSTLNGKNYWSLAFIPLTAGNVQATAQVYQAYAYVFPTDTRCSWQYDEATAVLTTDFEVETDVKEGSDTTLLLGLLPHQWAHLSVSSPQPAGLSYATVRGQMKTLAGNRFQVARRFYGVLPTLPKLAQYSPGFSPLALQEKVQLLQHEGLAEWTDSYNEGQLMNRLIQTARIADQMGDTVARNAMTATVKARLEDWLKAEAGEVAFLFYYNTAWSAMLGYPAGHGQDNNLNDHHFHWGYFIHAAAFMEQMQPGWASQFGPMINLLVRDASSPDREDPLFPFLRSFSPYAGHCWANGFASFPQGNDQESTSESMQFHASLIHWGSVTGQDSIRDLGIYLYTTEQSAVEEYWFDQHDRIFGPTQQYSLVSRVWGNSYDNGTFWTNDIAASYGIELYPMHGGALYMGHDTSYVRKLWNEMKVNTGILTNQENPNLWHDIYWMYLSLIDPDAALALYNGYPQRSLKFGVSDAQTYHWLHTLQALGRVDVSVTASHPLAVVFSKGGDRTYVAQNYGSSSLAVTFSDGFVLNVPPRTLATSRDLSIKATLTSSFSQAYPGGSVLLRADISGGVADMVEFVDGTTVIGTLTQAPYDLDASGLAVGRHSFYVRVYQGSRFEISNLVPVIVGEQLPLSGTPAVIPGQVQAGQFDIFEGGLGQGISYLDLTPENQGDARLSEYVDVSAHPTEGMVVGWISAGEWMEYTVNVQQAGLYNLSFRYASDNTSGGGPLRIESDGLVVKSGITVARTNGWNTWANKSVPNIPLKSGKQVLRLFFEQGECNLGRLTFSYAGPLAYDQPVAEAGANQLVLLPLTSATLDGTASADPGNGPLTYAWTQVYGPSVLQWTDASQAQPVISGMAAGVYVLRLQVSNGSYSDEDEVYVIASTTASVPPKVSIISPSGGDVFLAGDPVTVAASASDLIGTVTQVRFYAGTDLIGTDTQAPFEAVWNPGIGSYTLTAVATDDGNSTTTSAPVQVLVDPAPPCQGTAFNGHYDYRFSADDANPTLTFLPSQAGVGSPTCILYYGTDPNSLPGYNVTPNVPYQLNAPKGTRIYFYYTYSYPGLGEQNTSAQKGSYIIGTCQATAIGDQDVLEMRVYPNPASDQLTVVLPVGACRLTWYDVTGRQLSATTGQGGNMTLEMSTFPAGLYLLQATQGGKTGWYKVRKR
ncbi:MAG: glycosyl hydrolase [Bacteroidia bacterium]|nr:glycosyl hydrolase [Bacteroidia bacterium]